jgi:hypothetical protein
MLVTHHLLRKRRRLLEEAMSERGRRVLSEAPVWLESLGRLFAKRTPRPKAAKLSSGMDVESAVDRRRIR